MLTLRCTQKARKLLGVPFEQADDDPQRELTEWFVDTVIIERRKSLLFMHKLTLYSFWVVGVRKAMLQDLHELMLTHLENRLCLDGFPGSWARLLGLGEGQIRFAKTNDRRVVGSLSNHIGDSLHIIAYRGGLAFTNIDGLNAQLNKTPMGALAPGKHMGYPIEALQKLLGLADASRAAGRSELEP